MSSSTASLESPKATTHYLDHVGATQQVQAERQHRKSGIVGLLKDKRMVGICLIASISGFLFGYDQGVVGNVLVLESFGAEYPRIFMDASLKGWWVSTLLLAAWFGSLVNGPLVDRYGRRLNIQLHTIIFVLGAALQTGATNEGFLFGGRAVAGFSVGALTHTGPMYIAELAPAHLRGSLVAIQQLSITLGILFSYWIAYGTSHIGGTRCAPEIPYTGPISNGRATFDAYNDVPAGGCTGQSPAAWRVPIGIQIFPAIVLGIALFWMPYSPRWLVEQGRDEEAKSTLSYLRNSPAETPEVVTEYLEIKAEVMIQRELKAISTAGKGGLRAAIQPYLDFSSVATYDDASEKYRLTFVFWSSPSGLALLRALSQVTTNVEEPPAGRDSFQPSRDLPALLQSTMQESQAAALVADPASASASAVATAGLGGPAQNAHLDLALPEAVRDVDGGEDEAGPSADGVRGAHGARPAEHDEQVVLAGGAHAGDDDQSETVRNGALGVDNGSDDDAGGDDAGGDDREDCGDGEIDEIAAEAAENALAARLARASTEALVRPVADGLLPLLEARLPVLELVTRQYIGHHGIEAVDDPASTIISISDLLRDECPLSAAEYAALSPPVMDPIRLNQIRICVHLCLDRVVRSMQKNALSRDATSQTRRVCAYEEAQALRRHEQQRRTG
ncbi:MFS general substrate transporter [Rhodotorula sp. JG-1b]|nr:MFS general substrate transporter [Rhodotorula sp. JG-1b]